MVIVCLLGGLRFSCLLVGIGVWLVVCFWLGVWCGVFVWVFGCLVVCLGVCVLSLLFV